MHLLIHRWSPRPIFVCMRKREEEENVQALYKSDDDQLDSIFTRWLKKENAQTKMSQLGK